MSVLKLEPASEITAGVVSRHIEINFESVNGLAREVVIQAVMMVIETGIAAAVAVIGTVVVVE